MYSSSSLPPSITLYAQFIVTHNISHQLLAAQKAAHKLASEQPYSTSVVAFLKSAKPQIFNIFFAFLCVLLAYQIHGLRQGYKKLLETLEERDGEIGRLRGVLKAICDVGDGDENNSDEIDVQENNAFPSFNFSLSEKCTAAVQSLFAQSDNRPGYTWILARKLASGDVMESSRVTDAIRQVIAEEVRNFAGDVVWTEEELKKRRVEELKGEAHELAVLREGMKGGSNGQMSGLVEMLQQVHEEDLVDDKKLKEGSSSSEGGKVKRTRYAI